MPSTPHDDSDLRAVNAKIADAYDRAPYDPVAILGIDPERILGLAALHGGGPQSAAYDVLDLGCGTGGQLARVGALTAGRLIGTDLSQSACALAEERCAVFGDRARIICADFLSLDAAQLGTFDLIYHVGVFYITPPEVQRHLLKLIAGCLKPGGVAVISYYFGASILLMSGLQHALRLAVDPKAPPGVQVQSARRRINDIAESLARQGGDHKTMLSVLQHANARSDSIFFHELLNQSFAAISTAALEDAFSAHGVHFLNWMAPGPLGAIPSARERAIAADVFDFAGGGYHYAVFGKCDATRAANMQAPSLRWQTRMARTTPAATSRPITYRDAALGLSVTANVVVEAALDLLAAGPLGWDALSAGVEGTLAARGLKVRDTLATLAAELSVLWQHGLVTPLWTPVD